MTSPANSELATNTSIQTEQRQISEEIKAAKDRIKKVEKDIEDEHQRLSDADGGDHALRRTEIEERREEARAAKHRLREHEGELPALEDNVVKATRESKDSQDPIRLKRQDVQNAEGRLNLLVKDRGQQQQAYPENMRNLLTAIRQDEGFRQRPVGPLGSHVRLLKPLWSSVLEKSFGGALDAFIVTSKDDQIRLSGLMQKARW